MAEGSLVGRGVLKDGSEFILDLEYGVELWDAGFVLELEELLEYP